MAYIGDLSQNWEISTFENSNPYSLTRARSELPELRHKYFWELKSLFPNQSLVRTIRTET